MGDFHLVHARTVAVCWKRDRPSRGDLSIPLPPITAGTIEKEQVD